MNTGWRNIDIFGVGVHRGVFRGCFLCGRRDGGGEGRRKRRTDLLPLRNGTRSAVFFPYFFGGFGVSWVFLDVFFLVEAKKKTALTQYFGHA